MREITYKELKKIYSMNRSFTNETITFFDLVEIFGNEIWYWTDCDENNSLNLEHVERRCILKALVMTDWIQKEAAKLLGITKRVLNYKIVHHGINHPMWIRKNEKK